MMKWLLVLVGFVGLFGAEGPASAQAPNVQCVASAAASGTENAITIPALPCALSTNLLILSVAKTNTSSNVTLQPLGLPAQAILNQYGAPISTGDLVAGGRALLNPNGFHWTLLNPASQSVVSGGLGEDLFSFGCIADGATDQTSCINSALATYAGCVIVDPSTAGFYVEGTIVNNGCFVGANWRPINPPNFGTDYSDFAGLSWIKCAVSSAIPCIESGNPAASGIPAAITSGILFVGTETPSGGSIGYLNYGGFNNQVQNVTILGFDTCARWGPHGVANNPGISSKWRNTYLSYCGSYYAVDDGFPEIYIDGGRWGQAQFAVLDEPTAVFYVTKSANGTAGSGPNTIVIDNLDVNDGWGSVGCMLLWGGFVGTGGGYGDMIKITNSHFEFAGDYSGSAPHNGIICSDSTVSKINQLIIDDSHLSIDAPTLYPVFDLDPATQQWQWRISNSSLNAKGTTLVVNQGSGGAANYITITNSLLGGPDHFTGVNGSGGTSFFYSSGNTWGTLTIDGAWNRAAFVDDVFGSADSTSATGDISWVNAIRDSWTPTLSFGGATTGITYTSGGLIQRTSGGGFEASFSINLTSVGSATGDASIGGIPYTCASGFEATSPITVANFSGLISPLTLRVTSASPATISVSQSGVAGITSVTDANFTNTTVLTGTVRCDTVK